MDLSTLSLRISRSENLPVLSQVVSAVLKLADDPNSSPRALERVVERDIALTAKILKVANSSYYGGTMVPSIGRAISVLGINTIRSLVVGVAYQQMITGKSNSAFNRIEFWKHSLAVGVGSRILTKLRMPLKAEEMYGAGMMHDVGLIVLDKFMPEILDQAYKRVAREKRSVEVVLTEMLGYSSSEVGGLLAERWGLSPTMMHAIKYCDDPTGDPTHANTTRYIYAANLLAYQSGFGLGNTQVHVEDDEIADAISVPVEQLEIIRHVVKAEVTKAMEAFTLNAAA